MPFIFEFNNRDKDLIHTVTVNPEGWRGPLTIEYIVDQAHKYDTTMSVIWRIKGTSHSFTIPEYKINTLSHGDYKAHFELVLKNFRYDYLNWFRDEDYKDAMWKYDYQRQYGQYIISDENQ